MGLYLWNGSTYVNIDSDADGVIDWKALQFMGVRQSALQEFTDPKILIATSSMNELLNSADIVEAVAGNISSDSEELTIIGGSATATGHSWIYWNLPDTTTNVYVKAQLNYVIGSGYISVEFANADGETLVNPPDFYNVLIRPAMTTHDFMLRKTITGAVTELAIENIDLQTNTYYNVEFFANLPNLRVWRDGIKKFDVNDSNITSIKSVRFRCCDISTTSQEYGKVKGNVVVIYE